MEETNAKRKQDRNVEIERQMNTKLPQIGQVTADFLKEKVRNEQQTPCFTSPNSEKEKDNTYTGVDYDSKKRMGRKV